MEDFKHSWQIRITCKKPDTHVGRLRSIFILLQHYANTGKNRQSGQSYVNNENLNMCSTACK